IWQMNGTTVASTFTLPNPGSAWVLQDDGPITSDGKGSGGGAGLHLSAPDSANGIALTGIQGNPAFSLAANDLLFAAGDNNFAGSAKFDRLHPTFATA